MNVTRWFRRVIHLIPLVMLLAVTDGALAVLPAHAAPLPSLTCHASMSIAHPTKNTTTDVLVSTLGHAVVTTVAHYKSTNTTHHAVANAAGKAIVAYKISRATAGFRVVVNVEVQKSGRSGTCSTSFTPLN